MEHSVALLQGYSALDLTDLKGQLCGRLLADLGMEVIKVEPPGGDPVRRWGPFREFPSGSLLSLPFAHLNANKKSIILDLQEPEGRARFLKLAERADVVLESFAPGFLDSAGLGYHDLARVNSRLVMASVSGFGRSGPRAKWAVSDIVVFAMSGLMHISGDPSLPPCKPPETQAYYFGSLFAALGVVAALYHRERTGKGDHVDVSMQEALATQEHLIRLYANEGEILKREGSQHGHVAPAKIFPCRDGYVYLYVTRQHWKAFLKAWSDHPATFDGAQWENNLYRRAHAEEINREVERFTAGYGKEELTAYLQSRGIPCMPVNSPREFIADEQVRMRRFFVQTTYPRLGSVNHLASPFLIGGARPKVNPAPGPGEHQQEVFEWIQRPADGWPSDRDTENDPQNGRPLKGMRILSFDHVLAGPYGMTLLAELGAEVIKVESRRGGLDPFRFFGAGEDPNLSPRFLEFNRNKLSVTVNLKHPEGVDLIKDMARRCDAVVDNFSVRVMPLLKLGYEDLAETKGDVIALRMPGLGCAGPKSSFATVGTNITAFTGFTHLWNHPEKSDPPIGSQTVYPDYVSGVVAAILIVASVLFRERAGRGLSLDLSQAEAAAYMIAIHLMEALNLERDPEPAGNRVSFAAPHGCYPCAGEDRWCVIAVETEEQWRALARGLGRPELAVDPRFSSFSARKVRQDELDGLIEAWTTERDAYQVMELLQGLGVPCGVVQNGADLVEDEHLRARGFVVQRENTRVGRVTLPGFPLRFAHCTLEPKWEFPELGRDNEPVLRDLLGYSPQRIAQLAREGILE
ncbi:MAG: CoA transferase [Deltaproteobacteria bacterium]|nr:CoA transferase [Deltaproteobacteria bacterium]